MGARHRHPRRRARASARLRRGVAAANAVPERGEDRDVVGLSRHVDGRLHARLHGRDVGRQLRRRADAARQRRDRRGAAVEPHHSAPGGARDAGGCSRRRAGTCAADVRDDRRAPDARLRQRRGRVARRGRPRRVERAAARRSTAPTTRGSPRSRRTAARRCASSHRTTATSLSRRRARASRLSRAERRGRPGSSTARRRGTRRALDAAASARPVDAARPRRRTPTR